MPADKRHVDLFRAPGRRRPGDGVVHDAAHLGEPPVGAKGAALAVESMISLAGDGEFELTHCVVFHFIQVAHKQYPFFMRTSLPGVVGQMLSNQKNILDEFFSQEK